MTTLFVSDLHLEAERPDIGKQFLQFLETDAKEADDLYILRLLAGALGADSHVFHDFWQGATREQVKNYAVSNLRSPLHHFGAQCRQVIGGLGSEGPCT